MRYEYKIIGGFSEKQKMTYVSIPKSPSVDAWAEIEKVLRNRFRKYDIGKISHRNDGTGTISIDFRETNGQYSLPTHPKSPGYLKRRFG